MDNFVEKSLSGYEDDCRGETVTLNTKIAPAHVKPQYAGWHLIAKPMKIAALIFLCLSAIPVSAQNIPKVDFCKLVRNPAAYDKKIVRIKAFYWWVGRDVALYDPRCRNGDAAMETGVEESKEFRTEPDVDEKLSGIFGGGLEKGAHVTVIGRFHDWNNIGYGQQKTLRFQFMALKWVSVREVTPPPLIHPNSEFMMDARHLRFISSLWNTGYMRGSRPGGDIERDMAANYAFTDSSGSVSGLDPFPAAPCGTGANPMIGPPRFTFDGDTAMLKGDALAYSCPLRVECQYRYEHRFEKISGQWKLAKTHVTFEEVKPWRPLKCPPQGDR